MCTRAALALPRQPPRQAKALCQPALNAPDAQDPSPCVAVTGGTGFIGRHLLQTLVDSNVSLRALTRNKRPLQGNTLTWIEGSLETPRALEELVQGATHLVHLAGRVRGNTRQTFLRNNTQATNRLVEVCAGMRCPPRFLLLSSLAAREPQLSHYAQSKHLAEVCLHEQASMMNWTIFRPPAVYGPGDTEMNPLLKLASRGVFFTPWNLNHRLALIHVSDLVSAIAAWIHSTLPTGKTFELSDAAPNAYDWNQLLQILGGHYGRRVLPLRLPKMLLLLVGLLNLGFSKLTDRPAMLSPGKVREFLHPDWTADPDPIIKALNWRPQTPLPLGLTAINHSLAFD